MREAYAGTSKKPCTACETGPHTRRDAISVWVLAPVVDRRRYLGGCACLTGALGGCLRRVGYQGDRVPSDDDSTVAGPETPTGSPEVPVPESELIRAAPRDAIPAIVDPTFASDWSAVSYTVRGPDNDTYEADGRLAEDNQVIGIRQDGQARAYPLRVLNWHEVVNDTFGGPLLATYCPLCGSAMTAVREAAGQETVFGVSGLLYKNDLVMYDEATDSLWSQIQAQAIRGELVGERLELHPSSLTTWGKWREQHPNTQVLVPPPDSGTVTGAVSRNYQLNPYATYESSRRIGFNGSYTDNRLHPKTTVIGIEHRGVARAYPFAAVRTAGVVNDDVNGLPVVVAATDTTIAAYLRQVRGVRVTFERADTDHIFAAGSRWRIVDGVAVDGSAEGESLEQANDTSPMFFFAWKSFTEETDVWTR